MGSRLPHSQVKSGTCRIESPDIINRKPISMSEESKAIKKVTMQEAIALATAQEAATLCKERCGITMRAFFGLKGIESKEDFLKKVGKGSEQELSGAMKNAYDNCWDYGELLQVFIDAQILGLNPASRDVSITKKGGKVVLMPSFEVAMRRAQFDPDFNGSKDGIIVITKEGEIIRRQGQWSLPTETIVAGWCEVYRKNLEHPIISEISFEENKFNNAKNTKWDDSLKKYTDKEMNEIWLTRPAYMIWKCAVGSAFERAFPNAFAGYQNDAEQQKPIDVEYVEVKDTKVLTKVSSGATAQTEQPPAPPKKEPEIAGLKDDEQPPASEQEEHPFN